MAARCSFSSSEDDDGTSYGCTISCTPSDRVSKKYMASDRVSKKHKSHIPKRPFSTPSDRVSKKRKSDTPQRPHSTTSDRVSKKHRSHTPQKSQHKASTSSEVRTAEVPVRLKEYHGSSSKKHTYQPAQILMPPSATAGIRRKGKAPNPQRSTTMSDDEDLATESFSSPRSIDISKSESFQCSMPSGSPFIYDPEGPGGCTIADIIAARRHRPSLFHPATTESSEESSDTDCNPLPTKRFKGHGEFNRRQDLSPKSTQASKWVVAIDCEMVGCRPSGSWLAKLPVTRNKKRNKMPTEVSVAARCAIVDYDGNVLYDKYIRPTLTIVDLRTCISGITAGHMAKATPFGNARQEILEMMQDKVVVAHDIRHDLAALQIPPNVPSRNIRDTSTCQILRKVAGVPSTHPNASLRNLAKGVLGRDVQKRIPHSPVEDARIAMELYRAVEEEWEREMAG